MTFSSSPCYNSPCLGVRSCGSPLVLCPRREQLSPLPLKAQLPPEGRSMQPCPGSGFGSTVAKKTYLYQQSPTSKGFVSNHLTGAHEALPAFQLHISLCLSPMHALCFLLPCSPAQPLTPRPTIRVGLGGPLCVPPLAQNLLLPILPACVCS